MGKMDAWIYLAYGDRSHLSGECSVWLRQKQRGHVLKIE